MKRKFFNANENLINENQVFIWTEAFNCGELIDPFLESFVTHHNFQINVYCTPDDFKLVKNKYDLVTYHLFDNSRTEKKTLERILRSYEKGHKGTAELWSYLIYSRPEKYFIHLDADTIFLGEVISDLREIITKGKYSVVGSRRPYRFRTYRKTGFDAKLLNKRADTINTDCFAFDKSKIKKVTRSYLRRKIQGKRMSFLPIVDYFDPVCFELLRNSDVYYIDSPDSGYSGLTNFKSDFMQKRISFSAVGSGINFSKNPRSSTSPGYRDYALASYSLYSKYILNIETGIETLKNPDLEALLVNLDKTSWTLKI